MAGPGNEMAAGAARRRRLRASHADREQVIDILKTAFVRGALAKDEFDLRVGLTLASRTNAELAALTTDLPAGLTAAQPPEPVRAQGERPVRPGRVIMVATALCAGMWAFTLLSPWPRDSEGDPMGAILVPMLTLAYLYVVLVVAGIVVADRREKRSGGQPPRRRPAPGARGQASGRPPSAGPDGQLPPVDRGHPDTIEAARSRPSRLPLPGSRSLRPGHCLVCRSAIGYTGH